MAEKRDQPLIQAGGLSVEEIKNAIVKSSAENRSLIESVLADDRVSEEGLADSLAAYARFPRVNLATANIDPEAVKLLPQELARKYFCIPIRIEGRNVLVAMANPTDYRAMQEIEFTVGRSLKVLVCTRTEIADAIERSGHTYPPRNTNVVASIAAPAVPTSRFRRVPRGRSGIRRGAESIVVPA